MKVYLSGKIGGLESIQYLRNFAEATVEAISLGLAEDETGVVNPCLLPHCHDKRWCSYMIEDLIALSACDCIFMLNNWTDSPGARMEHDFAARMGLPIFYQQPVLIG